MNWIRRGGFMNTLATVASNFAAQPNALRTTHIRDKVISVLTVAEIALSLKRAYNLGRILSVPIVRRT